MRPAITKRLQLLESRVHSEDPAQLERLRIAVSALLDAFSTRSVWARAETAPFYLEEQPSPMDALWRRIQDETTTESDRAALDGLPACHLKPAQLVEAMAMVCAQASPRGKGYRGDTKWQG